MALGDDDAKVLDRELIKGAFFRFEVEVVSSKAGKDIVSQLVEGGEVIMEDEDVVKVDNEVVLVNEVRKNRIHKGLEGGRRIAEAKGHDKGFEEAKGTFEGDLPLISMLDANVVVTSTDVELCKVARALELVDEFRNQGQWSGIFYGDVVQVSVILNRSKAVALFF